MAASCPEECVLFFFLEQMICSCLLFVGDALSNFQKFKVASAFRRTSAYSGDTSAAHSACIGPHHVITEGVRRRQACCW